MSYTHLELARLHTEALYVHDTNNRLLHVNEPDPSDPTPRFFLFRTTSANIWRVRYDLPPDLSSELERLAALEPVVTDRMELRDPPSYLAQYTDLLAQHAPISSTYAGPAYYLPELPRTANTEAVMITSSNAPSLEKHYPYTQSKFAELAPVAARVVDSVAVAVCCSVRLTPHVAEAGVHTVEAFRGRGYAVDIVGAWAEALRTTGRLPLYSTSWENRSSQAVASKLGAVSYGADFSIT